MLMVGDDHPTRILQHVSGDCGAQTPQQTQCSGEQFARRRAEGEPEAAEILRRGFEASIVCLEGSGTKCPWRCLTMNPMGDGVMRQSQAEDRQVAASGRSAGVQAAVLPAIKALDAHRVNREYTRQPSSR